MPLKPTRKLLFKLLFFAGLLNLLVSLILILVFSIGRNSKTDYSNNSTVKTQVQTKITEPIKGVSFSPKSFAASDIAGFFKLATEAGTAITWAGDWFELGDTKKFPHTFIKYSKQYKFSPVIIVGLYNQGEKKLTRLLTEGTLASYKTYAVEFTKKYQPPFFGMGVEVDIMYENHPAEFEKFVNLFNETAKEVRKVSLNTKIFTAFQLEQTKGLRGGLFGGKNDPSKHNCALLSKFIEADFIAFTTYPHLIHKNPAEIPSDYYSEIKTRTAKKVAFIETGWPSVNIASGWESTETEQGQFLDVLLSQIETLDKVMVIWPFLYDTDTGAAFKGLGLIPKEGHEKLSWEKWKGAV